MISPATSRPAVKLAVTSPSLANLCEEAEKFLALLTVNRVHAQMRKAFAGTLSRYHTAVGGLNSCRSRFDGSRFSAAVVIALGILSSLMMAFPLLLKLSHPS